MPGVRAHGWGVWSNSITRARADAQVPVYGLSMMVTTDTGLQDYMKSVTMQIRGAPHPASPVRSDTQRSRRS